MIGNAELTANVKFASKKAWSPTIFQLTEQNPKAITTVSVRRLADSELGSGALRHTHWERYRLVTIS